MKKGLTIGIVILVLIVSVFLVWFVTKPNMPKNSNLCGGLAGIKCSDGYYCNLTDPEYSSDRSGACIKNNLTNYSESYIRSEIERANYCFNVSDCISSGVSIFGCNILVNKDEVARIENLIQNYEKQNIIPSFGCGAVVFYPSCQDGRCILSSSKVG